MKHLILLAISADNFLKNPLPNQTSFASAFHWATDVAVAVGVILIVVMSIIVSIRAILVKKKCSDAGDMQGFEDARTMYKKHIAQLIGGGVMLLISRLYATSCEWFVAHGLENEAVCLGVALAILVYAIGRKVSKKPKNVNLFA